MRRMRRDREEGRRKTLLLTFTFCFNVSWNWLSDKNRTGGGRMKKKKAWHGNKAMEQQQQK